MVVHREYMRGVAYRLQGRSAAIRFGWTDLTAWRFLFACALVWVAFNVGSSVLDRLRSWQEKRFDKVVRDTVAALNASLEKWRGDRAEFGRQVAERIEDEINKALQYRAESEEKIHAEIIQRIESLERKVAGSPKWGSGGEGSPDATT